MANVKVKKTDMPKTIYVLNLSMQGHKNITCIFSFTTIFSKALISQDCVLNNLGLKKEIRQKKT